MKSFFCIPMVTFILAMTTQPHNLHAEIETVVITWTPMECQTWCSKELDKQFRKVPGTLDVVVNQAAGQANITWQKNAPFDYTPVNMAMHQLGLAFRDIRLKVHGTIRHSGNTVNLVSSGDFTTFQLINPITPQMYAQSPQFNLAARALQPDLRQKLLDIETQHQEVTIEGPLFMPHRAPPLVLVADHINITLPADYKQKK